MPLRRGDGKTIIWDIHIPQCRISRVALVQIMFASLKMYNYAAFAKRNKRAFYIPTNKQNLLAYNIIKYLVIFL